MAGSPDEKIEQDPRSVEGLDNTVHRGGINQGQGTGIDGQMNDSDPADAALRARSKSISDLTDDNAAAHMGGAGAQGGQTDFGSQGNLGGIPKP
jgi:hypothetical protein